MNLFWLHENLRMCVDLYSDVHTYKMLLEATQLLSNAYYFYGETGVYKKTHARHPCSIWAAQSPAHFDKVAALAAHLAKEYFRRYHKVHKCWAKVMHMRSHPPTFDACDPPAFSEGTVFGTMGAFSDVPLCMDARYHASSATVAYRKYYLHKIIRVPRCRQWKKRKTCENHAKYLLYCS